MKIAARFIKEKEIKIFFYNFLKIAYCVFKLFKLPNLIISAETIITTL